MDSTSGAASGLPGPTPISLVAPSSTSTIVPITEGLSPPLSVRYESQKRRDMNTFLQYLKNRVPPLSLACCNDATIIEYTKHLDQFGKTKMHLSDCTYFGHRNPPAPCDCPVKQAWGSLDSLIGRLRAAFEENGGNPESNPFGAKTVRLYLKEVRDRQAKARGIPVKKKRKKPLTTSTSPSIAQLFEGSSGSGDGSVGLGSSSDADGLVTSIARISQMVDGCKVGSVGVRSTFDAISVVTSGVTQPVGSGGGRGSSSGSGGSTFDVGGLVTSVTGITRVGNRSNGGGVGGDSTFDAGVVVTPLSKITQVVEGSKGNGGSSGSGAGGVVTSVAAINQVVDVGNEGGGSTSDAGGIVTLVDGIAQVVEGSTDPGGGVGGCTFGAGGVVTIEQMMKPRFVEGTSIEVNLRDKQCHDAWFPATVLKEINHDLYLVQYNHLRFDDKEWCSKAIVDALHIRPSPPRNLDGKDVDVSQKVDVYYDCGWWSGEVTKVLIGNRYMVQLKNQMIGREFNQFELRCHMDWVNGKWIQGHGTACIGNEEIKDSSIPSCCKKLKKGEVTEGSMAPSPPREESIGSVFTSSSLANVEGGQWQSSKALVGCSQNNLPSHMIKTPDDEQQQCKRAGTRWRCPETALHGKQHCEKHVLERKTHNEKRRKGGPSRGVDRFVASDGQRCRRTSGSGWRCPEMVLPEKKHCEKHQLEVKIRNEKRRKGGPTRMRVDHHCLPPDDQRCRRTGTGWRCPDMVSHASHYCEKHILKLRNRKRRPREGKKGDTKSNLEAQTDEPHPPQLSSLDTTGC